MAYSNSSLVTYKRITSNKTSPRNHKIDTITIHCIVGQWTAKQGCDYFATTDRECSANYVVGKDGSIGLSVEEKDRAWTSSSASNDNRAVTIEVASDTTHPYAVTDAAMKALINLVADICKRNGIKQLKWKGDKSLIGQVDKQNMTVHRWFASTACPGDYLYKKHSYIAEQVNKKLGVKSTTTSTSTTTKKPTTTAKPKVQYQVYSGGKWWGVITNYNNVNSNGYAGVFGKEISGIRVKLSNGKKVTVMSHVSGNARNNWLPAVTKWDNTEDGYSGWKGKPTDCIAMKADGYTLKYRVHVKGGGWLSWISKCDINNYDNGLAGIYGKPIDAVQITVV